MTPKKIAAFALGPVAGAALGFITLPLVTWFFSQEDVGRMAMLNVAIGFCTLLFTLGLDQAYIREFHETRSQPALFKTAFFASSKLFLTSSSTSAALSKILFINSSTFSDSVFKNTNSFEIKLEILMFFPLSRHLQARILHLYSVK